MSIIAREDKLNTVIPGPNNDTNTLEFINGDMELECFECGNKFIGGMHSCLCYKCMMKIHEFNEELDKKNLKR